MRLDLVDLRLFLCVVDAGSITKGAARANLALASASERLRGIEAEAGVRLLDRRPRGIVPTEAGEALAHHARLILRQRELLQGELQDFASGVQGTVRLYANTASLTDFLPRRLASWLAANPRINIDLKERTSAQVVRAVRAGSAEAGVMSDTTDASGLQCQPVAHDRLVLIVAVDHPLAEAGSVDFEAVLGERFVGMAPGVALQDHINAQAALAGRALAFRIRTGTFDALCEMVAQGVGVAVVPEHVARQHRRRHPHRQVSLANRWASRRLCLCFQSWSALSAPVRDLLSHLGAKADAVEQIANC